jgi:Leucine-rich repeat (LRR) protein
MDLSFNRFTRIDRNAFASFPRLQKLSLKSNQLSEMATGSLDGLHDLETFDVSQNSLRRLPESIFAHTRRLTRVDLSHNQLQSLSGVFVDLVSML